VHSLAIDQVQQVLNEIELSAKLAQAGDDLRAFDGVLVAKDQVGEALGLMNLTDEPTTLLVGQFRPVLRQYQRARLRTEPQVSCRERASMDPSSGHCS